MEIKEYGIVDGVEKLEAAIARVREAQKTFATYTQEQVDKIFLAAAMAADKARISLAKQAVAETGMGVVEDKVIKNHYAAEYIYNAYKDTKTCGVIEENTAFGTRKIAEPIGVIAAVIPTTNPTSTAIFKTLLALKTRNGIIISPHPRAKLSTIAASKIVLEAAVAAGAPEGIIAWIDVPSLEMTNLVMKESDIILATGGPGMVKAAYSSGKPALGVGAGNNAGHGCMNGNTQTCIIADLLTHGDQIALLYQGLAGGTDMLAHGDNQNIRFTVILNRGVFCIMFVFLGMNAAKERSRHSYHLLKFERIFSASY